MGDYYYNIGRYLYALKWYRQVKPEFLSPRAQERYNFRFGYCLYSAGNREEAREYLSKAKETEEYASQAAYYLGFISYEEDDYQGANEEFGAVQDPKLLEEKLHYFQADMNYKLGKFEEAIEQAKAATSCALAMHHKLDELNEQRRKENLPSFEMRIGMHYGGATVGNFGSKKRVDYTVVGPSVNLASRIEQAAKPGEILMSSQVRDLLETGSWQKAGDYQLKGIQHSVTLYKVVATANKKVA